MVAQPEGERDKGPIVGMPDMVKATMLITSTFLALLYLSYYGDLDGHATSSVPLLLQIMASCIRLVSTAHVRPTASRCASIAAAASHDGLITVWSRHDHQPHAPRARRQLARPFSASSLLLKKGAHKQSSKAQAEVDLNDTAGSSKADAVDPFDASDLDTGIAKALEKLREDISRLRPGGRLGPESVERLRVKLDKNSQGSERLGHVAQVVPRGARIMNIIAGEAAVGAEWRVEMLGCR